MADGWEEVTQDIQNLKLKITIKRVNKNLAWVKCPVCGSEVSKLIEDICADCYDTEKKESDEKNKGIEILKKIYADNEKATEFRFENFEKVAGTEKAFEACFGFNPMSESLYIYGNNGSGKTHLGFSAIREAALKGRFAMVRTSGEVWSKLKSKKIENYQAGLKSMVEVPVFLLEDLGTQRVSESTAEVLYDFINGRYMACRRGLIITSNYSIDQLGERFGDMRIPSRLVEMCRVIKNVTETDYRLKKKLSLNSRVAEKS